MLGSIQIATVRNIPIRIHFTLVILFGLFVYHLGPLGVPAALLLFASTFLHELGHAVVAQRCGIPISSIELHLLGGTALMHPPKRPMQELVIALAGPLVSLALGLTGAAVSYAVGLRLGVPGALVDLLPYFAAVNLGMAIFNLLPALPMDGGRVLRALLSLRRDPLVATRIAARISRVIALVFLLFGVTQGAWTLGLFGVVIFWLAGREVRAAELVVWRAQQAEQQRMLLEMVARATGLRGMWPPDPQRPRSAHGDPGAGGPVIDV